VVGVTNEIAIKPRVNCDHLARDISFALNRSWFFDRDAMTVTVEGASFDSAGRSIRHMSARLRALTAWSAPGVIGVRNDIVVPLGDRLNDGARYRYQPESRAAQPLPGCRKA